VTIGRLHIVLYEPEIPGNTGSIIRLCANTGAALHVIKPLGFVMDDKRLRRAGLDYHEFASVTQWDSLGHYREQNSDRRLIAIETSGQALHSNVEFSTSDALLFGSETKGLPAEVLATLLPDHIVRLPMLPNSRSLNLANAVSIVVYEAWRQGSYEGAN